MNTLETCISGWHLTDHTNIRPRWGRNFRFAAFATAAFLAVLRAFPAPAAESAVVLMYHRFGEDVHPATNIRIEQFEAHLTALKSGGFAVLPLPEIVSRLSAGKELPARTIGIAIDDAFLSAYEEAWPRLRKAGFPFTLFVATAPVDQQLRDYMSWDQIRELAAAGVTIGSQTANHPHMANLDTAANMQELREANLRLQAELGTTPSLFAYPYGEASLAVREMVIDAGFAAAFGQHSGAIHSSTDLYYLPRFPMNENFGDLERFRLVADTLALPATDITPADPLLGENPPSFGFTVGPEVENLKGIACYASVGRARIERLGERRIEARFPRPFPPGRTRINCTTSTRDGRWRWFGMQYYVAP
jgi:peptidoglycan/xylan/chitin deacetylase (PgdA/CDA1 family)